MHSSILVPYHGWRISHRTHHSNHGHVENDESWHPVTKSIYDKMVRSSALIINIDSVLDAVAKQLGRDVRAICNSAMQYQRRFLDPQKFAWQVTNKCCYRGAINEEV